jgi:two-component system, cell cycle sensor histidine kinase and response regulator CckA
VVTSLGNYLRVLVVEDSEPDTELTLYELKRYGFLIFSDRVETFLSMKNSLLLQEWDIILSDNNLPQFSAMEALYVRNEFAPKVPFFIITGNLNDELISEAQKNNCQGFFRKGNLEHLGDIISLAVQ